MIYQYLNFLKEYTEHHLLTVQINNRDKFEDYHLKKFLQQYRIIYELIVLYTFS